GILSDSAAEIGDRLESAQGDPQASEEIAKYFIGGTIVVLGFTSILYFGCSELFLRGQTLGKRWIGLRVVKANGFALDVTSVFVRNLFRPVDHLAPLWIVPVLSARSQRFGDMAAGTVVVSDRTPPLSRVRVELAERPIAEARFRFDQAALARLELSDYESLEHLLDRWDDIPRPQLEQMLVRLLEPLSRRLKTEPPTDPDRLQFLEDLMAAEYRRQSRNLV
ncbi:MAG: RDD family protein, partial [Planctomycetaceae bacterium]|nr:RDD family protein [Planctomycetaceae bacterium]